jgi:hypothetical protein
MNHLETEKLLNTIQRSYPNFFKDFDHDAFEVQTKLWQRSLADAEYRDVVMAFEYWINTEKYPPSLAEFKPIVVKLGNPNALISPERAWELVSDAVRRFGSYGQEKAFQTFPEPVKRAVRAVGGWQKICATELGRDWDFLRKNFVDMFNDFGQEAREQVLLPESVLKRLQHAQLEGPKQEKLESPK